MTSPDWIKAALVADFFQHQAVFCINRGGQVQFANEPALRQFGLSSDQVLGKNVSQFLSGADNGNLDWNDLWQRAQQRGRSVFKGRLTRPEGNRHPLEVTLIVPDGVGGEMTVAVVEDVSEREGLLESLRLSRDRSRKYFELAKLVFLVRSPEGEVMDINHAGCEILGYTREDIIGKKWVENFTPPDDRQRANDVFRTVVAGGNGHEQTEGQVLTRDGRRLDVCWHNSGLRDDEENLLAVISAGVDVTEQRRIQAALADSELKYRTFVEQSRDLIYSTDDQGRVTYLSSHFLGPMSQELSVQFGRDGMTFIHPDDREMVRQEFFDQMAGAPEKAIEFRMIDFKGRVIWGEEYGTVLRDGKGKPLGRMGTIRNVTDRKEAEARAKEGESRFREIAENLKVGIYRNTPGPTGRFLEANSTIVKMFEAESRDDLLRHNVSDLYWDPSQRLAFSEKISRDGRVVAEPLELKTLKGRRFWGAVTATMKKDDRGETYFDGIIEDISTRKMVEDGLRWQSEIGQQLTKMATEFAAAGNFGEMIGSVLKSVCGLIQADRGFLGQADLQRQTMTYTHEWPDDGHGIRLVATDVPLGTLGWSGQSLNLGRVVRVDNVSRDIPEGTKERQMAEAVGAKSILVVPLPAGSEPLGVLTFVRFEQQRPWTEQDVKTAELVAGMVANALIRHLAAVKLAESERLMSQVTNNVSIGVFRAMLDSPLTIIQANQAAVEMVEGDLSEQLRGKRVVDLVAAPQQLEAARQKALREKSLKNEILELRGLKGRRLITEISGQVQVDSFGKQYFDGVIEDVTEKRKTEAQAQQLDSLKSTFIQVVSHQVRTPLNSIRWSLETLLSEELGKLTPSQKDFLRVVYHAEAEILDRLNEMLTALDIEENRVSFRKSVFSLESVWASVMAEMARRCQLKGIDLRYQPPAGECRINGDAEKIRAVMANLADNAVDYTPENGKITATIGSKGDRTVFSVTDTGIGIPAAERDRIFTRFYRATNAPMIKPDATGLGLAISKYYVEQHQGKIGFESELEKGSTFWFELPAA